jgi:hypothetical protein
MRSWGRVSQIGGIFSLLCFIRKASKYSPFVLIIHPAVRCITFCTLCASQGVCPILGLQDICQPLAYEEAVFIAFLDSKSALPIAPLVSTIQ